MTCILLIDRLLCYCSDGVAWHHYMMRFIDMLAIVWMAWPGIIACCVFIDRLLCYCLEGVAWHHCMLRFY